LGELVEASLVGDVAMAAEVGLTVAEVRAEVIGVICMWQSARLVSASIRPGS
jgi:hypothetical protein